MPLPARLKAEMVLDGQSGELRRQRQRGFGEMDWTMLIISYGMLVCLVGGAVFGWAALLMILVRDLLFYSPLAGRLFARRQPAFQTMDSAGTSA